MISDAQLAGWGTASTALDTGAVNLTVPAGPVICPDTNKTVKQFPMKARQGAPAAEYGDPGRAHSGPDSQQSTGNCPADPPQCLRFGATARPAAAVVCSVRSRSAKHQRRIIKCCAIPDWWRECCGHASCNARKPNVGKMNTCALSHLQRTYLRVAESQWQMGLLASNRQAAMTAMRISMCQPCQCQGQVEQTKAAPCGSRNLLHL